MSTPPITSSAAGRTLQYGGSAQQGKNGKYRLSPLISKGQSFKKTRRLENIVRMENAGLPERAIATMLVISVPRLRSIKKSPEYLAVRLQLTHGIILDNDQQLAQIKEQRREMLTQLLPPALQAVAAILTSTPTNVAEKKLQVSVAQDLMDREGMFAKISRTEVKPVSFFDFETTDQEATSILHALRGASKPPALSSATEEYEDLTETSAAFSNSSAISAIDQDAAMQQLEADVLLEMPSATEQKQ